jgi:hypothetical protein
MIITASGRRIDVADAAQHRFPLANVATVRKRVREFLEQHRAAAVVCSAACGADLIVLSEAGALGLRRKIVLPFDQKRFRESSVTDRPGDWRHAFDQAIDSLDRRDLIVMKAGSDDAAYAAANGTILDEAIALGREMHSAVAALLVWEGTPRPGLDLTDQFGGDARRRGLPIFEVKTL